MRKRQLRIENRRAGLTRAELAQVLPCSQVCCSCYELGRRDIPTGRADYYQASIGDPLCRARIADPYLEKTTSGLTPEVVRLSKKSPIFLVL